MKISLNNDYNFNHSKVYAILTVQLVFTFAVVAIFVFVEPIKSFAKTSIGFGLYIAS